MGEKKKQANENKLFTLDRYQRSETANPSSGFRVAGMAGLHKLRKNYESDSALARASGVSQPTINKVLSGKQDPRLKAFGKLMDLARARIVFPWDEQDRTRRVVLDLQGEESRYLAVLRYELKPGMGGLEETNGGHVILERTLAQTLSASLSLGVVRFEEHMPGMSPCLYPGDDMLVDFSAFPNERSEVFLVRLPEGQAVAARCSLEEAVNKRSLIVFWEDRALRPRCLTEGKDFARLGEIVLAKVVFVMGGIRHRL